MRYEKYIGDISIELEGEPEEIIQLLEYLDGVDDKSGEIVLTIDGDEIGRVALEAINKAQRQEEKILLCI